MKTLLTAIAITVLLTSGAYAQGKLHLGAYPAIPETPSPFRRAATPPDTSQEEKLRYRETNTKLTQSTLVDFASWSNMYLFTKDWNERNDKRNENRDKLLQQILEELQELNRRARSNR